MTVILTPTGAIVLALMIAGLTLLIEHNTVSVKKRRRKRR